MVKDTLFVVKDTRSDDGTMTIFDNCDLCIDFIAEEFGHNLVDITEVTFENWCYLTNRYTPEMNGDTEAFFDFEIFKIFIREKLKKNIYYFADYFYFDVEIYQRDETGAFS
jgi:hypothetical protein